MVLIATSCSKKLWSGKMLVDRNENGENFDGQEIMPPRGNTTSTGIGANRMSEVSPVFCLLVYSYSYILKYITLYYKNSLLTVQEEPMDDTDVMYPRVMKHRCQCKRQTTLPHC